ncbi:MAG: 50S ribosomal protein L4 [Bacilli bacterium]|nr:50S ribosomal protein L4 [Bacilli bacterium]
MPKVVLYNQTGSQVGEIELSEHVFGVEDHQQAIFDTVIAEQAAKRQGTQKAKTRSEVSGGGRKPWRQKGTGRARQGTIRAPQFRGGGVVFAPVPRSYVLKVNKKVARLAMRCALSNKVREGQIYVVESLELADFKTKSLVKVINDLKVNGRKVAIVLENANGNVEIAGHNLPYLLVQQYNHISVYEMMNVNSLIITKAAVEKFEEVLK